MPICASVFSERCDVRGVRYGVPPIGTIRDRRVPSCPCRASGPPDVCLSAQELATDARDAA
jgi:hypothetical protein